MLQRLKRSSTGKKFFRVSRRPILGWPIRVMSKVAQHEMLQLAHLKPENRAHNRTQTQTLADFERRTD